MKILKCNNVQADEAGDERFQVLFEKEIDNLTNYFLIQRDFECEDIQGKQIYIECDDLTFTGFNMIETAYLERNRFYIKLNNTKKSEIELHFNISIDKYQEILKILKIIFTGFNNLKVR